MKKGLFTLLLSCMALAIWAQPRVPKVPDAGTNMNVDLQWSRSRPASPVSGFLANPYFVLPEGKGVAPRFAKAVGDGTEIFGSVISANTWTEDKKDYGIYSFTAGKGFKVNSVKPNGDMSTSSAVYANGFYYTWRAEIYFGQVLYILGLKYNAETWEVVDQFEPEHTFQNVPYSSSIAYDSKEDKIYAITFNADATGYALSSMNEDASFSSVANIERPLFTLAFDPEGQLFGLSPEGDLYKVNKQDGTMEKVGSTNKAPKYAQSMTFDPNTGKLYWAFINDTEAALYEVNPTTASVYKIDNMPNMEEFVGLFVKSQKVAEAAPAAVTELKFEPSAEGSATGTVSCKAPATTQKGGALSGNVKVTIYSGDEVLVEETVAPGAVVKKDNVVFDANQLYTLYAVASNEAGNSRKSSVTVFIGKDEAGSPQNVELVIQEKKATLTWAAPEKGLHDGYFDPNQVTYKVIRYRDDVAEGKPATTEPGVTTYAETLPSATGFYKYKVIAVVEGREGGEAYSNAALSVGAYELPFFDEFKNGELCNQLYTFVDVESDKAGDGNAVTNGWFWKADEGLIQICVDQNNRKALNDWMFTPAIHLDGKNLYNLTYTVNMGAASNWRVTLGTSADPAAHTTVLDEHKGEHHQYSTEFKSTFKVPADGTYYLGFYSDTDESGFYFNLFNIKVEAGMTTEIPDSVTNLKVTPEANGVKKVHISFNAPETLVNGTPIDGKFNVNLYRGNDKLEVFEVVKGQEVNYTDEQPVSGNNTYKIAAEIGTKEGFVAERTVWAGPDQPEAVHNFKAVTVDNNMHVKLTWEAPTKGVNGGYFDISKVTYSVWRGYEKNKFERIAEGLTTFEYLDTDIEKILDGKQDAYYYTVTADVDDMVGEGIAKYLIVGTLYTVPNYESFENGKFRINPWTIESIEGSFGFECKKNDDGGGYPQDADKGFTKFINGWGDSYVDSRLKTPVFSLKDSKNPSFSFFMFHWEASSVEADGGATLCQVEISVDGGEFKQIGEDYLAGYERYGWVEHRISLADYRNAETVQFALRGKTNNNWMYYYIDNIRVEEQEDNDLAVMQFTANEMEVEINESNTYMVSYFNRGLKEASGYTVDLYLNGKKVDSTQGEPIKPGEVKVVELKGTATAHHAGQAIIVQSVINYEADGLTDNNYSPTIEVDVKSNWYPKAEGLKGTSDGTVVDLVWNEMVIPADKQPVVDGAEEYEPFAITGFGDWITYDGDQRYCGSFNDLPDYPNKGKNQAWQIWVPAYLDGAETIFEKYPVLKPRTGDAAFVSWYANTNVDGSDPFNKDYLISPQVCGGTDVSFWIRKMGREEEENFQILYSTSTQDPDDFNVLREGTATEEWTEVKATLPADARYFAICYIGELQTGIMVDDISYVPAIYDLKVEGYNVFRDGVKLNEQVLIQPAYTDKDVEEGKTYAYQVSVVYNFGESNACESVKVLCGVSGIDQAETAAQVEADYGVIRVTTTEALYVSVYTIDGKTVGSEKVNGIKEFTVEAGIYIVKTGNTVIKICVK